MPTLCSNTIIDVSFQTVTFSSIYLTFTVVAEEVTIHLGIQYLSPSTCGLSFITHVTVSVRYLASVPEFK